MSIKPTFYRYIRPVLFDEKRTELVTQKKGGICLRFEIDGNSIWFTHSRCEYNEVFSKKVAKKIADERAKFVKEKGWSKDGFCGAFQITKDTFTLCQDVVHFGLDFAGKTDHEDLLMQYWALEYLDLSAQLHFMLVGNDVQESKLKSWKDAIEAAKYSDLYNRMW